VVVVVSPLDASRACVALASETLPPDADLPGFDVLLVVGTS
jgi:hypothetical protein